MSRRYSTTYKQIKNTRPKARGTSGFSLFKGRQNRPKKIRSESDRAGSLVFGNPYRRRHSGIMLPKINKKTLCIVFLVSVISAWLSILLYAPYFTITSTRIGGLKNIKNEEIKPYIDQYLSSKSLHFFKNSNFFVLSENTLSSVLKQHFYVEDIQITKVFPNQLNIDIQEKISSVIYDNGSEYVILDENGTVVKQIKACTDECVLVSAYNTASSTDVSISNQPPFTATNATTSTQLPEIDANTSHKPKYDTFALEYLNIPVVYDSRHHDVTVGNRFVLLPENIATIESIYTKARKNEKNYNILYFVIDEPGSGVKAVTDKGFAIYFSLDNDLNSQFNFTRVVLKDNKPSEYIDVRYANRVFWK